MATVYSLMGIEGDRCSLKRLVFLCSKINVFSKDDIEGLFVFEERRLFGDFKGRGRVFCCFGLEI
ncbi:hypothetical protein NBO_60g0028 [Nosema bombycis CQ1]|uniref:Uncharacterized protein n=1 Tax=Nosema bombycis (strain CQ1 / CVCC 102059) TaxID=578461 RepID=R0KU71_NOSB1|nr:hypothetical protein NBO_60g0028 [Nosema bombycis CQ1]|eukprot:EOB13772.1 hypothetical protein NBO_60g0028 [Nosema bombycis CQ1]